MTKGYIMDKHRFYSEVLAGVIKVKAELNAEVRKH